MSYILDALKKSESERQRHGSPGVADLPRAGLRRQPPRWLWIVAVLLAANVVVLSAVLLRPQAGRPVVTAAPVADVMPAGPPVAAVPDARAAAAPGADEPPDAEPERPPAAATAQASATAPADTQNAAAVGPADTGDDRRADDAPEPARAATAAATEAPAPAPFIPPTFTELRARGQLSLPDLHLDIHVWSPVPEERFVFVNMNKYRERELLAEGPRIREISPEGVVLEQRGTVFLLPRE